MLSPTFTEALDSTTRDRLKRLRLFVLSDAAPERNGVGTYYRDLADHLEDHVEHVELLAPGTEPKEWMDFFAIPLPGDHTQKIHWPNLLKVRRRIRAVAPHVIIVPTPGPYGLVGFTLARRYGAGLLFGFHTHYDLLAKLYWRSIMGSVSRRYLDFTNRVFFKGVQVVVANTQEMADAAQTMGAGQVEMVGTPVARPFIDQPVEEPAHRLRTVLYAGRLAPEKNVQAILEAAEELRDLQFYIAGDGPLRELVADVAAQLPNLYYLGWVPRNKVMSLLDSTDMLVLPSHVESFGTIALEAMARERLVLVSGECGILKWPTLAQGLFSMGPGESLADAITRISGLEETSLRDTALHAREAARTLNDGTLLHWLRLLSAFTPAESTA